MSSPNHPTSNIEDVFSFNFPDYTTASPGNISPDPSDNLSKYLFALLAISHFHNVQVYNDANKPPIPPQDPITPLAISPFHNVQVYNDANKPPIPPQDPITPLAISPFHNVQVYNDANKPPISPQNPITPPTILTPSPILPPSPLFDPRHFFVPEELLPPKKQIHPPSFSSSTLSKLSRKQIYTYEPSSPLVHTLTLPPLYEPGKDSIKMHLWHHEKQMTNISYYLE
uniref:Reverse transcriptase domain-containing protein n=1 Tax=Tanacetum cinerariifolium TaxID=118510 RepID=A0A6L2NRM9_TANCI|nr:hypothetical protein [Tanacetum cinerariifolium]